MKEPKFFLFIFLISLFGIVSIIVMSSKIKAQNNELVGLWRFDENEGSIAYDSSSQGVCRQILLDKNGLKVIG